MSESDINALESPQGVCIKGLGTVFLDCNGVFTLQVDPNGCLANLGYSEKVSLLFSVSISDQWGCNSQTCFSFTATGGDHGVTVNACVTDGNIQMASDCSSCGCVETPPHLQAVDLCADATISAASGLQGRRCDLLPVRWLVPECMPPQDQYPFESLSLSALEHGGVVIPGLGTVT